MVRLLVIGSEAIGSLESAYARSLVRLGSCEVDFFDIDRHTIQSNLPGMAGRIAARALGELSCREIANQCAHFLSEFRGKYDVVLMFKAGEFARDVLDSYRLDQPHAVWINLNPDDPFSGESGSSNSRIKGSISFFDLYVSWSRQLTSKLQRKGCKRAAYLPFGYDPDFHKPPRPDVSSPGKYISFVGAWDKQRETVLETLATFDLRIFGKSWTRVSKKSPLYPKITARNIYGKELANVIFNSGASLNLLRPQNLGAHNMRTFEIPAMGGLMLTTRSSEQQEYFPENEACLMFDTTAELGSQIEHVFADHAAAASLRSKAKELVKNHSYIERAKALLRIANAV